MKYALPITWLIVFLITDCKQLGFTDTSPLYTHITYQFAHAGLLHLAMNAIAYIGIYAILCRIGINREAIIAAFISATLAPTIHYSLFTVHYSLPTVGASGFIYALLAAPFASVLSWKRNLVDKSKFLKFYIILFVATALQCFIPNVNVSIHVISFVINAIILFIYYASTNKSVKFVDKKIPRFTTWDFSDHE